MPGIRGLGIWRRGKDAIAMKPEGEKVWVDDEEREADPERPAVYYAPRGECEYCDRRRAAAARSMRALRERGE